MLIGDHKPELCQNNSKHNFGSTREADLGPRDQCLVFKSLDQQGVLVGLTYCVISSCVQSCRFPSRLDHVSRFWGI